MPSSTQALQRGKRPAAPPTLDRLNVVTNESPVKKSSGTLGVILLTSEKGDIVKRYNEAKKLMQDNEAIVKELEPTIKSAGMSGIFRHNCADTTVEPIASVKVQDVLEDLEKPGEEIKGELCRVTFQARYNNCDSAVVEAAFADFKERNINDYVATVVEASFDNRIWLNKDGSMNVEAYKKVTAAVAKVASELGFVDESGAATTPLRTVKKVRPLEDFHQRRFLDFTAKENVTLYQILPNTVSATPLRS